jgi:hypothetical protein
MRSGTWRGVTLALGLACGLVLAVGDPRPARADGFYHTIPDLVPAVDLNTGGPYNAPPIPYGHYVGTNYIGRCTSRISGLLHGGLLHGGLLGHGCGPCGACGGKGCGACGGTGDACGGQGCGDGGCGGGLGHGLGHGLGRGGLFHKGGGLCGHASTTVCASGQGGLVPPPPPSPQCVEPGCQLFGRHKHRGGCGDDPCKGCGGRGCGLCGGLGGLCKGCGGRGCGLCGGLGGLCKACGGLGCGLCARARGMIGHMLGRDRIDWFVGPGGPVPLTPGYTPYVNVTRSPRDFLAFPPFVP